MIAFLKKIKHTIDHAFITALHTVSKAVPRDPNKWVFIGWHRNPTQGELFADNTKYLFLHVSNNPSPVSPVWLAKSEAVVQKLRDAGYVSYYEKSLQGIWHALRAGKTVIDAFIQPVNFRWSGGTVVVQLMHGRGMKKNAYSEPQPCAQDIITVTSPFTESLLPASFIRGSKIFVTGYPRNDIFFKEIPGAIIDADTALNEKISALQKTGTRVILYSPTFRRGQKYVDLATRIDIPKLSAWLRDNNAHMIMSLHPKYRDQARTEIIDCISFIDDCDIYPSLARFDLFINDYSSLFVDELLIGKPMVFFPFDLEEYSEKEGVAFDYRAMMPGPIAMTTDELLDRVAESLATDPMQLKREETKNLYHAFSDGDSAARVCAAIASYRAR